MHQDVQYANWWSKALFKKKFEEQFFIPVPSSTLENALFKAIEKYKFNLDFSGIPLDRPIFIIGLPRSGTSLLYNLLCYHEDSAYITNSINACPESICAIEWLRKKLNLNVRGERFLADSVDTDMGSPSEPATLWGKWIGRDADSLFWDEKRAKDLPPGKIEEIHNDVRKIIFTFAPKAKRFVCKYPVMQTELRMVQDLFPDAHFIHIIRDSRQAANSLLKLYHLVNDQIKKINHPTVKYIVPYPRLKSLASYIEKFGADDIRTTAHIWQDSINVVQDTSKDLRNYTEIKYEDLLKNPKSELQRVFNFCGMNWPAADNLQFNEEFAKIGVIRHTNKYKDFDLVEDITRPTLQKLGYL